MKRSVFHFLVIAFLLGGNSLLYAQSAVHLFDDFGEDWRGHWRRRSFTLKPNQFNVVKEKQNRVLKIVSKNAATGLWRDIELEAKPNTQLSWRWKTQDHLTNTMERKRSGDDFVGRVYVAFGEYSWLNRKKLQVICYVWASHSEVNEIFPNSYADNVKMFVLRNRHSPTGMWQEERRNLLEDYKKCFGGQPKPISAIGIMSDTDNTNANCTFWFDEMILSP